MKSKDKSIPSPSLIKEGSLAVFCSMAVGQHLVSFLDKGRLGGVAFKGFIR